MKKEGRQIIHGIYGLIYSFGNRTYLKNIKTLKIPKYLTFRGNPSRHQRSIILPLEQVGLIITDQDPFGTTGTNLDSIGRVGTNFDKLGSIGSNPIGINLDNQDPF